MITNALHELKEEDEDNLVNAYARLAKKIAMRLRLNFLTKFGSYIVKAVNDLFISPGKDAKSRIGRSNTKAIRITCLKCGHVYRKVLNH